MNAMPARKKRRCVTSTAAITLPTNPVSEIAFGVRRDWISRLRASSRISAAVHGSPRRTAPRRREEEGAPERSDGEAPERSDGEAPERSDEEAGRSVDDGPGASGVKR